jgi:hypothetical protein
MQIRRFPFAYRQINKLSQQKLSTTEEYTLRFNAPAQKGGGKIQIYTDRYSRTGFIPPFTFLLHCLNEREQGCTNLLRVGTPVGMA